MAEYFGGQQFGEYDWKLGNYELTLTGSVSGSGNILKDTVKSLTGSAGSITGAISHTVVFVMNLAGSINNLSGSIPARAINKSLTGSMQLITGRFETYQAFRTAIMKAGRVIRKVIRGGSSS